MSATFGRHTGYCESKRTLDKYPATEYTSVSRHSYRTMTTRQPTDGATRPCNRDRTIEVLTEALEADELTEKDYQIREALHLLTLNDK